MRSTWAGFAAGMLFVGLAGCSGGGGGSGGGNGDTPIVYTGNSNPAALTTGNVGAITANVVGTGDVSQALASLTPPDSGSIDVGRALHRTVRATLGQARSLGPRARSAIAIDDTSPCDSGSVRVFGTLNDNGTGTVQVQYSACRTGGITVSGNGSMRVDAFDLLSGVPTDFTLNFVRLTVSGSAVGALSGSLRLRLDARTRSTVATENLVVRFASGTMTKSENLMYVDTLTQPGFTESVSGRVFHSVHGWVDISTVVPLLFGTLAQEFPDGGVLQLAGAGGGSIRLTAQSATSLDIALDFDGNGIFDRVVTLAWTDLSGPAGADLADEDGDGMHNSWEVANGLDPLRADDAGLDGDGDGFSNLVEYLLGANPRNPTSVPVAPRLGVVTTDSPDPVAVGGTLTYTITVCSCGSSEARNVTVVDTLPAGVDLVSASTQQGSCTGSGPVTCDLGTLRGAVLVTIVVTPTAPGVITNRVTVSTSSHDLGTTDNKSITTTTVGTLTAGLQARIDAALDGQTVVVEPGTYLGGLNFNGKNIVLESRDGPLSTIIHGNQGTAVRIGPRGAIRGFTVTGAFGVFAGAIEVLGSGSVISGNIFDGNGHSSGGGGAAIGGNLASPIIERNLFRNHFCHPPFSGSVIWFVNDSSPQILNNIFENNPCDAINLSLPNISHPQTINNTFVGNNAAIRFNRGPSATRQIYRNNIIVRNGTGLRAEFGGSDSDNPVWTNNLVFGNTADYSGMANLTGSNGNISADPHFVNQTAGNYDLLPGSPAIDAASAVDAPTVDFEGTPRVRIVDIGAFEGP